MWKLADKVISSRFLIGTAQYPSLLTMINAIVESQAEVITLSLKRQHNVLDKKNPFWSAIKALNKNLLPNTAGCHNAEDAVTTAEIAREIFETNWIKLEVIGDDYNLQPDSFELVKAADKLVKRNFEVFPYATDDLVLSKRLIDCGCKIIMPWASPIGSGKGVINAYALQTLRERLPDITLIIDAGIGKPSHAAYAMELGFDGVLLNTAVSSAQNPILMAAAFRDAIAGGRAGYLAGLIHDQLSAKASTPLLDTPFWHQAYE